MKDTEQSPLCSIKRQTSYNTSVFLLTKICLCLTVRDGVEGEAVSFSFPAASPDLESLTRGRDHDASFHGIDPSGGAPQPPTPRCPCGLRPHAANAAQCAVRHAATNGRWWEPFCFGAWFLLSSVLRCSIHVEHVDDQISYLYI